MQIHRVQRETSTTISIKNYHTEFQTNKLMEWHTTYVIHEILDVILSLVKPSKYS